MEKTGELIESVRRHRCLYDHSDREYKNYMKKCKIWEQVAKELNETSESVKHKWKNLRDGYTKYRKLVNCTGQKKKYQNWVWGPYLQFLDGCINYEKRERKSSPPNSLSPGPSAFRSSPTLSSMTGSDLDPSVPYNDPLAHSPRHSLESPPVCWYSTTSSPSHQLPLLQTLLTSPNTNKEPDNLNADEESNYKNKNDSVDLLFMSYAETFRKLTPRTQASLKVKLAQVFADAELSEIESSGAKRPKAEPL